MLPINFSLGFRHLCSFVAIRSDQPNDEVLLELLLHCLYISPDLKCKSATDLQKQIASLFGVEVSSSRVDPAFELLKKSGRVVWNGADAYILASAASQKIADRIERAHALERDVHEKWCSWVKLEHPLLECQSSWASLQAYLQLVFRRHGVQTLALLDRRAAIDTELEISATGLLAEALKPVPDPGQKRRLTKAISDFVAGAAEEPVLRRYLIQLADGAFSYFSLSSPPEIAAQLRSNLQPLTIFLDTNVLFAILNLHSNPLVRVSNELVNAISANSLPFKLRYLVRTRDELLDTIGWVKGELAGVRFLPNLSYAAAKAETVSGIQRKYHEANAASPTRVEDFFRPYEHADVILRNKGIEIYNAKMPVESDEEYDKLWRDYEYFLADKGKFKPAASIEHDITLLHCVHGLRSKALSTLDAGAICVTCDYRLYEFDLRRGTNGIGPCAILPNTFLQLLRPFLNPTEDFDKSFAQSFALAEFRTVDGESERIASRVLGILSGLKDVPETTATQILTSDTLFDRIKLSDTTQQVVAKIESDVLRYNAQLEEDRAAMAMQLKEVERQREEQLRKAQAEREQMTQLEASKKSLENEVIASVAARNLAQRELETKRTKEATQQAEIDRLASERERLIQERDSERRKREEERKNHEKNEAARLQRNALMRRVLIAAGLVLFVAAIFILENAIANKSVELGIFTSHVRQQALRLTVYATLFGCAAAILANHKRVAGILSVLGIAIFTLATVL